MTALLLVPGGGGGASSLEPLAAALADRYEVAVHDAGRLTARTPEAHAADLLALLDELSPEAPADVFASSSGAIAALALLAARPDRVRRLIAHEPPLVRQVPAGDPLRALFPHVREVYLAEGAAAAVDAMSDGLGEERPGPLPPLDTLPPEAAARMRSLMASMEVFLGEVLVPYSSHDLDIAALDAARLVPAAGEESRGKAIRRPVDAIAARLGLAVAEFPGGHVGYAHRPAEAAETITRVLG